MTGGDREIVYVPNVYVPSPAPTRTRLLLSIDMIVRPISLSCAGMGTQSHG